MVGMVSRFRSGLAAIVLVSAFITPGVVLTANAGQPMHNLSGYPVYDTGRFINTEYHYKRGVKHFEARDYTKAYKSFYQVLLEKPQDANTNYYMARVMAMRGNHRGAISKYKQALRYYTNSPILLAGLGNSYVKSNQQLKARNIMAKLDNMSNDCNNTCEDAPQIAVSLHIVALSLFPEPTT